jgi:hypothetical protein
MTLPEQSERAVAQTREFLVRLTSPYVEGGIKGIRREVRAEASRLLRHYPLSWNSDFPKPDNMANGDKLCPYVTGKTTKYCTLTPFTLTDEEREAVETAAMIYEQGAKQMGHVEDGKRAVALRGLLKRLSPA